MLYSFEWYKILVYAFLCRGRSNHVRVQLIVQGFFCSSAIGTKYKTLWIKILTLVWLSKILPNSFVLFSKVLCHSGTWWLWWRCFTSSVSASLCTCAHPLPSFSAWATNQNISDLAGNLIMEKVNVPLKSFKYIKIYKEQCPTHNIIITHM